MKPKFRTLVAIAVGTAILVSVSADASNRGSVITPNEAQRIAGSDGTISRAEVDSYRAGFRSAIAKVASVLS